MKTYKIIISKGADTDIKENLSYIKNVLGNITAAKRLSEDIRAVIELLSEMPYHNTIIRRKEFQGMNVRRGHVRNYNVFYTIREDAAQVEIIRVLHQRQNWIRILKNKGEANYDLLHEDPELYDQRDPVKDILTRNSADLRNSYSEISKLINSEGKIVRITQKGKGDMFAISIDEFEQLSKSLL